MKSTTRFTLNKRDLVCLNCSQPLSDNDNFCSNCGQVNDNSPISIGHYFSEYLSGFFSFDNRFLNTVIPLIFKPGEVTANYVNGKRKRYVNPFQLYLNVTILFFLIQGIFSTINNYNVKQVKNDIAVNQTDKEKALFILDSIKSSTITNLDKIGSNESLSESLDSIKTTVQKTTSKKDTLISYQLRVYIDSVFAHSNYLEKFNNTQLTKITKDSLFNIMFKEYTNYSLKLLAGKEDIVVKNWNEIEKINVLKIYTLDYIETVFSEKKIKYIIPSHHRISIEDNFLKNILGEQFFKKMYDFMEFDNKNKDTEINFALAQLGYPQTSWNIFYYSKAQNLNKIKSDPEFRKSYLDNIVSKISVALFFLLPIFTLVVALLYIRNKYNYTQHLVFVFHVQTVFFILLILTIIFDKVFNTDIGMLFFFLIFLFYLYKSLRNFYKQGRIKTTIKFFILNTFFVVLSMIGGVIISFLAFLL